MKGRGETIAFDAVVERLAPEAPRFVVFSGRAWDETATFIVDVSLNQIPIRLRNLIPWKERGWHFGLSKSICYKVGVDTGDRIPVEMHRLGDTKPQELEELLDSDSTARSVWEQMADSDRRDLILFVSEAKRPETHMKRAKRLLDWQTTRLFGRCERIRMGCRIEELQAAAEENFVEWRRPGRGGSHVVFSASGVREIVSAPSKRPIKPVYVKQFLKLIDAAGGIKTK